MEFAFLRESLGVSRISHIFRVYGHTTHDEERKRQTFEVGQRSLERLFPGFTEHSTEQGAATGGLLPEQPLSARLDALVEAAAAAFHDSENPIARLYLQMQTKQQSWQQTVQGHNCPTTTNSTIPESEQSGVASQHGDDDSEPTLAPPRKSWLSAPQLQAQLSRLTDRTRLRRLKGTLLIKGAWQQVTRIAQHPDTARLHQQGAKKIGQSELHKLWSVPSMWIILGRSA